MHRGIRALVVAGVAAIGVAGCDPLPPRLALTVDSSAAGADDAPGDGVCSSAAAGGACTLQAAIEEGNLAEGGADLTVPAGLYRLGDVTVTGDLRVNPDAQADVAITDATVTVAAGGRLGLTGVNTSTHILGSPPVLDPWGPSGGGVHLLRLAVAGTVDVVRSMLGGLDVSAGGGAVIVDSIVDTPRVTNSGKVLAVRSSILGPAQNGPSAIVLHTRIGGSTHLASSVVAVPRATVEPVGATYPGGQGTCVGLPVSASYLHVEVPCGDTGGIGDGSGNAGATIDIFFSPWSYQQESTVYGLEATSPLVDAIPLGTPGCDAGTTDVYGNPRGVDGNGDGVGGCDIGAVERQP